MLATRRTTRIPPFWAFSKAISQRTNTFGPPINGTTESNEQYEHENDCAAGGSRRASASTLNTRHVMKLGIPKDQFSILADKLWMYFEGIILGIGLGMFLALLFVPENDRKMFPLGF